MINLNKALFELPESIGFNNPFGALKTVTLKSTKYFEEQYASMAELR